MTRMHLVHDEAFPAPQESRLTIRDSEGNEAVLDTTPLDLRSIEQIDDEFSELTNEEPAWGADPMAILEFKQEHES
jgi:hypothetical protein